MKNRRFTLPAILGVINRGDKCTPRSLAHPGTLGVNPILTFFIINTRTI
jgi:hypothetical protein